MYREFFSTSPLLAFPLISLALFGGLFVFAVVGVYGRARLLEAEARARMIFDDEEESASNAAENAHG